MASCALTERYGSWDQEEIARLFPSVCEALLAVSLTPRPPWLRVVLVFQAIQQQSYVLFPRKSRTEYFCLLYRCVHAWYIYARSACACMC